MSDSESNSDNSNDEYVEVLSDEEQEEMEIIDIDDNSIKTIDDFGAYSPVTKKFAFGCMDDSVRVYSSTFVIEKHLSGFKDSVEKIKFDYLGRILVAGDMAGNIMSFCFNDKSNDWIHTYNFSCGSDLLYMDWFLPTNNPSCSKHALITSDLNGTLNLWPISHMENLSEVNSLEPKFIAQSPDEIIHVSHINDSQADLIGYLTKNCSLKIVHTRSLEIVKIFKTNNTDTENCSSTIMEVSTGKSPLKFAIGHEDGQIVIVNVEGFLTNQCSSKTVTNLPSFATSSSRVEAISFSEKLDFLAFGNIDGMIGIIDHASNNLRCKWSSCQEFDKNIGVTALKWMKDNPYFVTASLDFTIQVWPGVFSSDPTCLLRLTGHTDTIMDLLIINEDQNIITCSEDKTIKVFDLKTSK